MRQLSLYTKGQKNAASILLTIWLLINCNPNATLAAPRSEKAIVPAATTSPSDLALASALPTPQPGGILQLPPDSPYPLWGSRVASSPAIDAAPQSQRTSSLLSRTMGKLASRFSRPRPCQALSLQAGPVAEGDENARDRAAAVQALVEQLAATPSKAPAILQKLIDITKEGEDELAQAAARKAFLKVPEAAPSEARAIIPILAAAAKEHTEDLSYYLVRRDAVEALLKVLEATPEQAPAIIPVLTDVAMQDPAEHVRAAAHKALAKVAPTTPDEGPAAITLQQFPEDTDKKIQGMQSQQPASARPDFSAAAFISPKEQEAPRAKLFSYYSRVAFACVPSLFDEQRPKHVKNLQCHLMLRRQQLVKESKEAAGRRRQGQSQLASHHMHFEEIKTPIGLQDLFKKRSIKPGDPAQEIQRILLTGDPGTGKTTLSRKLAYQWAVGTWGQEFKALYLLPVSNLQQSGHDGARYNREKNLATAIVNNCFLSIPEDEDFYNRLREHIKEELKKPTTLVILDGLDERRGASEELLRQVQQGSHKLLMLSRPYSIDTEQRIADIEIEHAGLNDEQLRAYVQAEVPAANMAKELLGYIYKHENILAIAHVPVNLQILCALWQDECYGVRKQELQQGSLPSLYRLVTNFIWKRYTEKWRLADENKEELFDALGQIALAALEQGEVLISPSLIDTTLGGALDAQAAKAAFQDAGFLLLQYVERAPASQSGFYQFPHRTFQEYFAGHTLARQFCSDNSRAQQRAKTFLARHKYAPQYARTLSFMAGEVSSVKGVEGIQALLKHMEEDKEIMGLQHLLLQLRAIHAWLCLAQEEVDAAMAMLDREFQVQALLEQWFVRAFTYIRREGYEAASTGHKLLSVLTDSLRDFGAIATHVPQLFQPLKKAAQDYHIHVRRSALESLGKLVEAAPSHAPVMLNVLLQAAQDREVYVRSTALESFGKLVKAAPSHVPAILETLRKAAQDEDCYVREAALPALGKVAEAAPNHAPVILETLHQAAQDHNESARGAALEPLGQAMSAAPHEPRAIVKTLHQAADDEDWHVRQAAISALKYALKVAPDAEPAILETLYQAAQDENWRIREDAVKSLGRATAVVSHDSRAIILQTLYQAAQDEDEDVRRAAVSALGRAFKTVPDNTQAMINTLRKIAAQDEYCNVREAAFLALVQAMEAAPRKAQAILETLHQAAQHKNEAVRQAAVSALVQAMEAVPGEARAILDTLRKATQDEDVQRAAFEESSLEQLLESYWPKQDASLIPYITPRLYYTPLVAKSPGQDRQQVLLYATAGEPRKWDQPQEVVERFAHRIQAEQRLTYQIEKAVWERYFGQVGAVPPLPADIAQILDSPCPFWAGNKVKETHLLVLVPERVGGQALTLDYLGKLVQRPQGSGYGTQYRYYYDGVRQAAGDKGPDSSYWVLMTRDVLPGSRYKSYREQCQLVSDHAARTGLRWYGFPNALEASVVMLLHHVRSRERLYGDNPWTYTRCRDKDIDGWPLIVGGFSSEGLHIDNCGHDSHSRLGVAALRKF